MKKWQLRIETLSDLCVSDGNVYNSLVDTDICYDEYGFPYIPAKRIKGCLRECALELSDWGVAIPMKELFGEAGFESGNIRIGNAMLSNVSEKREEIIQGNNTILFHPQNILNYYSYIRTQTSLDQETGVAKDTSLRTTRVANKGLTFVADVEADDEYVDVVKKCCTVFTNMGNNRTRGMGEIKAELIAAERKEAKLQHAEWQNGADYLAYTIYTDEAVICKSVAGGEAVTQDYIEGSKVFGMIATCLKKQNKDVVDFLNQGELICANAYIGGDGYRYTEVPACFYSIKNNKTEYINQIYAKESDKKEGEQLNQMKHCYVKCHGNILHKKNVITEEHYHHRRADDKSKGRAMGNAQDGKGLGWAYQMHSISPNQELKGFIIGTPEQIKVIYDCLSEQEVNFIGYARNSQYGKVRLQIEKVGTFEDFKTVTCKELLVKLDAPAIVYSDKAFYSTNVADLLKEIEVELDIPMDQVEEYHQYINYTTLGGYNVTWNCRKPTIEAFDKGSVLHIVFKEDVSLKLKEKYFIGERITEGYGETTVEVIAASEGCICRGTLAKNATRGDKKDCVIQPNSFAEEMCKKLYREYIKAETVKRAQAFVNGKSADDYNAVISNMILMCKEADNVESVKESVKERFEDKSSEAKRKKADRAKDILKLYEEVYRTAADNFKKTYSIQWDNVADESLLCLTELMMGLKYAFRIQKGKKGENK